MGEWFRYCHRPHRSRLTLRRDYHGRGAAQLRCCPGERGPEPRRQLFSRRYCDAAAVRTVSLFGRVPGLHRILRRARSFNVPLRVTEALPKKMFDNILVEIDPTIAAVSVLKVVAVLILFSIVMRGRADGAESPFASKESNPLVSMSVKAASVFVVKSAAMRPVILELRDRRRRDGHRRGDGLLACGRIRRRGYDRRDVRALRPGAEESRIIHLVADLQSQFLDQGRRRDLVCSASAIEQALWDIKGKRLGVPVYEMLGGRVHDRLRAYANGWCMGTSTVDEFLKAAEMPLRDGFKAIKCYPLASTDAAGRRHIERRQLDVVDRGVEKIRRLREVADRISR